MLSGYWVRMSSILLVAFLFFGGVNCACADEKCEEAGLLQVARPASSTWTTPRDLATVSPSALVKFNDMELRFSSVVPTFGPQVISH